MGELISRELLIEDVQKSMENNPHTDDKIKLNHHMEHFHFLALVNKQPVAYDVKAIIEQLEDERQDVLAMADESDYFLGQLALLNRVIPLLKGAGKDV